MPFDPIVRAVKTIDPIRMRWRRRQMALIVTLIGLGTSVTPLIRTESEVLGRTRWSPLEIFQALRAGALPIVHGGPGELRSSQSIEFLVWVGLVYVALGVIAVSILFFPSPRFIQIVACNALGLALGSFKDNFGEFRRAVYGARSYSFTGPQVDASERGIILIGLCGLLIWIGATKELD